MTRGGECPEPEFAWSAEIETVEGAIDPECGGEATGATSEVEKIFRFAMALHEFDTVDGFESADEDSAGSSGGFAGNIEHEVSAVVEENVRVAGREIHGADARSRAAKMVPRRITGRIGFGFDDAPAKAAFREVVDDNFANEEPRESDGIGGKLGAAQTADADFIFQWR